MQSLDVESSYERRTEVVKDDLADPAHPAELQWCCGDTDSGFHMTINLSKVISSLMMMWSIFYLEPPSIPETFLLSATTSTSLEAP